MNSRQNTDGSENRALLNSTLSSQQNASLLPRRFESNSPRRERDQSDQANPNISPNIPRVSFQPNARFRPFQTASPNTELGRHEEEYFQPNAQGNSDRSSPNPVLAYHGDSAPSLTHPPTVLKQRSEPVMQEFNHPYKLVSNRLRSASKSPYVEIRSSVQDGYRMFAPVRAFADPSFDEFGDTIKEAMHIFDLISMNLKALGQNLNDVVLIVASFPEPPSIYSTEESQALVDSQMRDLELVLSNVFTAQGRPMPQVTINHVPVIADRCTVEFEVTALFPFPNYQNINFSQPGPTNLGRSEMSPTHGNSHYGFGTPTYMGVGRNASIEHGRTHGHSPFGDILPPILAHSYGFYGEPSERIRAGIKLMTILRILILILSPFSYAIILATSLFHNEQRLGAIFRPTIYFLVISVLISLYASCCTMYGLIWLYFAEQNTDATSVFLDNAPLFLLRNFPFFSKFSAYGDVFIFCFLLSGISSIFAVVGVFDSTIDSDVKGQFKASGIIGIVLLFLFMISSSLSSKILEVGRMINFKLPVASQLSYSKASSIQRINSQSSTRNANGSFQGSKSFSHAPTTSNETYGHSLTKTKSGSGGISPIVPDSSFQRNPVFQMPSDRSKRSPTSGQILLHHQSMASQSQGLIPN